MSKTKILLIPLLTLVFLFSILIGGAFAFQGKELPILKKVITIPYFEKNPEQSIELMMEKIKNLKSFSFNSNINIISNMGEENLISKIFNLHPPYVLGIDNFSATDPNSVNIDNSDNLEGSAITNFTGNSFEKTMKLNIKLSGKADNNDPENFKQEMTQNINMIMGGMNLNFKLQNKNINEIGYLKIDEIPSILTMFIGDQLINKWIKIDPKELINQENGLLKTYNVNTTLNNLKDTEKIKQEITKIGKELNIIKVGKRLEDEVLDENNCYHYQLNINLDNLGEFYKRVFSVLNEDMDMDKININIEEKTEETINKIKEIIKRSEIDIWIDKDEFYLRKTSIDFLIHETVSTNKAKIEINGDINYSDFNKEIEITAPSESESIITIIKNVFGVSRTGTSPLIEDNITTETLKPDTDGDGLSDEEEIFHQTDPKLVDTDSDGLYDWEETAIYFTDPLKVDTDEDSYSDGSEVFNGYNPIGASTISPNSPELFIINFRKNLNCDHEYNKNLLHYNNDLFNELKNSLSLLGEELSMNDIKNEIESTLFRVPENIVNQINFIHKEDNGEKVKLKYKIIYNSGNGNNATMEYENNLIKINNEWKLNAFADALDEIKEEVTLESARIRSQSAKTIADVKQIQTALELYYSDMAKYPDSIYPDIKAQEIYISKTPLPLTSTGICQGYDKYVYESKNEGRSYGLTFCLQKATANIPMGIHIASPSGITDNYLKYKHCK